MSVELDMGWTWNRVYRCWQIPGREWHDTLTEAESEDIIVWISDQGYYIKGIYQAKGDPDVWTVRFESMPDAAHYTYCDGSGASPRKALAQCVSWIRSLDSES